MPETDQQDQTGTQPYSWVEGLTTQPIHHHHLGTIDTLFKTYPLGPNKSDHDVEGPCTAVWGHWELI